MCPIPWTPMSMPARGCPSMKRGLRGSSVARYYRELNMADEIEDVQLHPKGPAQAADKKVLEERWTTGVLELGFVFVPSVLLRAQKRLHIDAVELTVLFHLIDHWWENDNMPFPSKKRLAERIGVSDKTVQRAIKHLEDEKLIQRVKRHNKHGGQTSNIYDLAPLIDRLKPIAKELVEARDEAQKTRRSPEKPGHTLRRAVKKKAASA